MVLYLFFEQDKANGYPGFFREFLGAYHKIKPIFSYLITTLYYIVFDQTNVITCCFIPNRVNVLEQISVAVSVGFQKLYDGTCDLLTVVFLRWIYFLQDLLYVSIYFLHGYRPTFKFSFLD